MPRVAACRPRDWLTSTDATLPCFAPQVAALHHKKPDGGIIQVDEQEMAAIKTHIHVVVQRFRKRGYNVAWRDLDAAGDEQHSFKALLRPRPLTKLG